MVLAMKPLGCRILYWPVIVLKTAVGKRTLQWFFKQSTHLNTLDLVGGGKITVEGENCTLPSNEEYT